MLFTIGQKLISFLKILVDHLVKTAHLVPDYSDFDVWLLKLLLQRFVFLPELLHFTKLLQKVLILHW